MIITTSFSISASSLRYLKFCSQGRSHKNEGDEIMGFPLLLGVFICILRLLYRKRIHLGGWTRKKPLVLPLPTLCPCYSLEQTPKRNLRLFAHAPISPVNFTSHPPALSSATFRSPLTAQLFQLYLISILLLCDHNTTTDVITVATRCRLGFTSSDSDPEW